MLDDVNSSGDNELPALEPSVGTRMQINHVSHYAGRKNQDLDSTFEQY